MRDRIREEKKGDDEIVALDRSVSNFPVAVIRFERPLLSTDQMPEQNLSRRRVLEERENQFAMPVERRRPADDRHDTVSTRQLKQLLYIIVGHSLCQPTK